MASKARALRNSVGKQIRNVRRGVEAQAASDEFRDALVLSKRRDILAGRLATMLLQPFATMLAERIIVCNKNAESRAEFRSLLSELDSACAGTEGVKFELPLAPRFRGKRPSFKDRRG